MGTTETDQSLRVLAEARGIGIGAAVAARPLRDEQAYRDLLAREFNMVTTENALKFGPLRPDRETFAFANADEIVDFALDHGMSVRGHTLLWHHMNPPWLKPGDFLRREWETILRDHIGTVVGRYRGKIAVWDVVNEAVRDRGDLRDSPWLSALGPDYIAMAFRLAHKADPDARLFYNDFNAEGMNPKSDAVYSLVKGLLADGVPIHGVGFQMHLASHHAPDSEDVAKNVARLNGLGLEVQITEIDVAIKGKPTEKDLQDQARIYGEMLQVCLAAKNATAFVMWGLTDGHSWIPHHRKGWGAALVFDGHYQPKPAYFALRDALD